MTERERKENLTGEVLDGLVRVGTVTDRRMEERLVRVLFADTEYTSDWLPVLINRDCIPEHEYDDPQWTEYQAGGSGEAAFERHRHALVIQPWMPKVGDEVLTLYLPVFNADGFVLGGIRRWR